LSLNNCSLTDIVVNNHTLFQNLSLMDNHLTNLDISNLYELYYLRTLGNPELYCIKGDTYHINKWLNTDDYEIDSHTIIATSCD
jgi:hypothetical protein